MSLKKKILTIFFILHLCFFYTITLGFSPSPAALGNMFKRGGVTRREAFYLTAGSRSDTGEKQQEGRGMEEEIAQKDRVT